MEKNVRDPLPDSILIEAAANLPKETAIKCSFPRPSGACLEQFALMRHRSAAQATRRTTNLFPLQKTSVEAILTSKDRKKIAPRHPHKSEANAFPLYFTLIKSSLAISQPSPQIGGLSLPSHDLTPCTA